MTDHLKICSDFSLERMATYMGEDASEANALASYQNNILLCEALYPTLHMLEVLLRNRLEDALKSIHGDEWFWKPTFVQSLNQAEASKLNDALEDLKKENDNLARDNKPIKRVISGRVVAQMSFGFWTGLLGKTYQQTLWNSNHKKIFPAAQPSERRIELIRLKINRIRFLRNRVMHHEPIWNNFQLWDRYQEILDFIAWISPDVLEWSESFDRFPNVFEVIFPKAAS